MQRIHTYKQMQWENNNNSNDDDNTARPRHVKLLDVGPKLLSAVVVVVVVALKSASLIGSRERVFSESKVFRERVHTMRAQARECACVCVCVRKRASITGASAAFTVSRQRLVVCARARRMKLNLLASVSLPQAWLASGRFWSAAATGRSWRRNKFFY